MNAMGFQIDFEAKCDQVGSWNNNKKIISHIFCSRTGVQNSKICDKPQDMVTEDKDADDSTNPQNQLKNVSRSFYAEHMTHL